MILLVFFSFHSKGTKPFFDSFVFLAVGFSLKISDLGTIRTPFIYTDAVFVFCYLHSFSATNGDYEDLSFVSPVCKKTNEFAVRCESCIEAATFRRTSQLHR